MNDSTSTWWHILVRARISLFPAAAGRALPIHSGYRPNHKLSNGLFCMGLFRKIEGEKIYPGETAEAEIIFLVVDPFHVFFTKGMEWDIHEGSLKVGTGKILEVCEEKKAPD